MTPKILVIRGGAIGDFILTLPAIALLREAFPAARLEILGYEHIVALATSGDFADASRSIEYGPMGAFFNPKADLDPDLSEYFGGFQQVISYLFDPDGFFSSNLRRCGVKNLIEASPKIDPEGDHAVRQLARPLERLALYLEDPGVQWRPGDADRALANVFLPGDAPFIALHPGSGGEKKNWPLEHWTSLVEQLLAEGERLIIVGGEADARALALFCQMSGITLAEDLPLPQLGAILAQCRAFVGHDSGISHLAAAAGARCLLLFGPTDPDIWAPPHRSVQVLRAPGGELARLSPEEVSAALRGILAWAK